MGKQRLTRELETFNKPGVYWDKGPKILKRSAQLQREPTTATSGTTSSGDTLTGPSPSANDTSVQHIANGNGVTRYEPPIPAWKVRSYEGDLSSQDSSTDGEDEEGGKTTTKSRDMKGSRNAVDNKKPRGKAGQTAEGVAREAYPK